MPALSRTPHSHTQSLAVFPHELTLPQDTYRAAFFLANKLPQYTQVEVPVSSLLQLRQVSSTKKIIVTNVLPLLSIYNHIVCETQGKWIGRGLLHHHPDHRGPLFIHKIQGSNYDINRIERHVTSHVLLWPSCTWNAQFW